MTLAIHVFILSELLGACAVVALALVFAICDESDNTVRRLVWALILAYTIVSFVITVGFRGQGLWAWPLVFGVPVLAIGGAMAICVIQYWLRQQSDLIRTPIEKRFEKAAAADRQFAAFMGVVAFLALKGIDIGCVLLLPDSAAAAALVSVLLPLSLSTFFPVVMLCTFNFARTATETKYHGQLPERCGQCGYLLESIPGHRCPECGYQR